MLRDFGTEVAGELGIPNQLSMASIQSIETLHRSGHSNREIARILGIDRLYRRCHFAAPRLFSS